jgi:hypothetical protein
MISRMRALATGVAALAALLAAVVGLPVRRLTAAR